MYDNCAVLDGTGVTGLDWTGLGLGELPFALRFALPEAVLFLAVVLVMILLHCTALPYTL